MIASFRRVLAIVRKEIRQLRRDRLTAGMIVGIPTIQILIFGFAINQDVRHLKAGVCDLAESQSTRAVVADAEASQVIDVVVRARTAEELTAMLREGRIAVGIFLPEDFERRAVHGQTPAQLLIDGTDPQILQIARALSDIPLMRAATVRTFEVRAYYNPERRSAVQIVPALIGVILTMTMVLFTSIAIVRERERGTLEMLITTPVKTPELMVGKILPYILIGLVQVTLILVLALTIFRVPVRGTFLDLYLAATCFITASLAMGLFISTLAQTQFQAMQMTFFYFLPSILLSGFMFPFDGMPPFAKAIGEVLPLTHFVRCVRGILLRGASLWEIRRELYPLGAFFTVMISIAILRFRKRLD